MKLASNFLILIIKFYKYFISPYFPSNCRYLPTCSEYFMDCLKFNGILKGSFLGIKRILRCHPIKILGGNGGFDPVPNSKKVAQPIKTIVESTMANNTFLKSIYLSSFFKLGAGSYPLFPPKIFIG